MTVESTVEHPQHVETVQVVLDEDLLKAADRLAARLRLNRSALVREALRTYLQLVRTREREAADKAGYGRIAERASEFAVWDPVASWPED